MNKKNYIKLAKKESISFAFLPKYKKEIQHSNASAFVVLSETDLDDKYGIVVEDPYLSMISILDYFDNRPVPEKNVSTNSQIHNSVNQPVNFHIGSFSVIDKDTVIGENVKIDNQVHIAHNVKIGENCMIAGQVGFAGSSVIGNNVMIGGQAGISGHLKIGNNVQIGGGSGVIKDIPDNTKVMGYPAKNLKNFLRENK